MAMAMFYGWENDSGLAFIKGKNLKKNYPAKIAYPSAQFHESDYSIHTLTNKTESASIFTL